MYLAHFIIFLCVLLQRFAPVTLGLYVVFVAGQIVRARIEEGKLAAAFPEYEEYRRTTGMFFPRIGKPQSHEEHKEDEIGSDASKG
jgi:protein-S-isoprenylcysteine O-methyltransferase Ste14